MKYSKNKVLITAVLLFISALSLQVVFGENGLIDRWKKCQEKERLIERNRIAEKENDELFRIVCRLKDDPVFIENVARHELGMIREDEVIFRFSGK